jgi:hypothetical protein
MATSAPTFTVRSTIRSQSVFRQPSRRQAPRQGVRGGGWRPPSVDPPAHRSPASLSFCVAAEYSPNVHCAPPTVALSWARITHRRLDVTLDFFGHTGNFVIASDLALERVAARLTSVLHTRCAVMALETVKQCALAARVITPPPVEARTRWTPGAVFPVGGSTQFVELPTSPNAIFRTHASGVILAWKRDRLNDRGRLDKGTM